ncbi:hypothetical protein [Sediminihabitans luteus]|uniref:hypothetical protein n=1 Tax=Sediminihabitans luteus TaxID=1138585 RepID=UPI0012FDDB88|nr:hypothetical protein [Sediminihabitans luteus]
MLLAVLLAATVTSTALWIVNYQSAQSWVAKADDLQAELDDALVDVERAQDATASKDQRVRELTEQVEALDADASSVEALRLELESRASELDEREKTVTTTEERIAASTITEGTWTVGTDIAPGTYRTTAAVGGECYWSIERSGSNGSDIVENDIVTGGFPTVVLSEGQDFTTNRCGSWAKQ